MQQRYAGALEFGETYGKIASKLGDYLLAVDRITVKEGALDTWKELVEKMAEETSNSGRKSAMPSEKLSDPDDGAELRRALAAFLQALVDHPEIAAEAVERLQSRFAVESE
jgi:hypothetical protein